MAMDWPYGSREFLALFFGQQVFPGQPASDAFNSLLLYLHSSPLFGSAQLP
jgi:hypothetical protein